ncbi:MAG: serine/threonine-protein kinase [Acidobacteriota bacterium]
MSNRERWQKLDRIFQRIWESPPQRRAALLDEACGDDSSLRADVESLLASAGSPTGWLDGSAANRAIDLLSTDPALPADAEVGQYRLLEPIGRGGMGVVYLAERSDGQYDQRVALKVIKRGMDTDFLLARFRRERQILAQLDHPGIAKLLDGGATADGRPYLVMEYIEGVPIDVFVSSRNLGLEARLELFLEVCDAVRSSHRQLVIHRDLKPSNILVTGDGQPKLLDFGTAKLLEDVSSTQTAHELRFLTPGYASPEQIQGGPITTAADIFGLGVLLYELLTDLSPFPAEGKSYQEVSTMVCERQPPRPSQVAPEERRKRLRGDLDAIVLCALRKEPEARFESVAALVDDLERFRAARPVRARSGTWRYRSGRFLRRNRLAVGAAVVVALLALTFLGALFTEQRKTQREKIRAEAVTGYLQSLFEGFNPFEGEPQPVTALEMLDRGAERVERELAEQPAMRLEILAVLARIYGDLGHRDRQRQLANRALELIPEGESSEREGFLLQVAAAELSVGKVAAAKEALAAAERARPPGQGGRSVDAAQGRLLRARAARLQGELELAVGHGKAALAELRALRPRDDATLEAALLELGTIHRHRKEFSAAREVIEEAVDRTRQRLGPEHPRTMGATEALGTVLFDLGDWQMAQELMDQVIENRRRTLGENHPEVIASLYNLGALAAAQGRFDSAEQFLEDAIARMEATYESDHPQLVFTRMWFSRVALDSGRPEAAAERAAAAYAMAARIFPETHRAVISCLHHQALAERLAGRAAASRRLLEQALALADRQQDKAPSTQAYSHLYLAEDAIQNDRLEDADRLLDTWAEWSRGRDGKLLLRGLAARASLALRRGDTTTAEEIFDGIGQSERESLEIHDRLQVANLESALALVDQRFERAERLARSNLDQALDSVGPTSLAAGQLELSLGLALLGQGRKDEARGHLERAVATLPESWDRPPQGAPSAREALASVE